MGRPRGGASAKVSAVLRTIWTLDKPATHHNVITGTNRRDDFTAAATRTVITAGLATGLLHDTNGILTVESSTSFDELRRATVERLRPTPIESSTP